MPGAPDDDPSPLFSVIVPTYRRPDLLPRSIASVLAQTVTDLEVIVVDDASPEPPAPVDDDRVSVLVRTTNGGPAAAVNTGAAAARGRYLTFLDDDDLWMPHRLELALAGLARAPLAICWSRYRDEVPSAKPILDGDVRDTILDHVTPHRIATAVERSLFEPFDESFFGSEDVEWWMRMSTRCDVATVPEFGALVTRHPEVRGRHGDAARIEGSTRLLAEHQRWFAAHPHAAALRWQRVGLTAARAGDRRLARQAYARSLRCRPSVRPLVHLARTFRASATP